MVDVNVSLDGVFTLWSIAPLTAYEKYKDGLVRLGLDKYVPEQQTPPTALRHALESTCRETHGRFKIERMKDSDALEVIAVERGEFGVGNTYRVEVAARIDHTFSIELNPRYHRFGPRLVEHYNAQLGMLHTHQIAKSLVDVIALYSGVRLKPSGGVYWLPSYHVDDWKAVANVAESCAVGTTKVFCVKHQMDKETVRLVHHAITEEITSSVASLNTEIESGKLGRRALQKREDVAVALQQKVELYEKIIGSSLTALQEQLLAAQEAAAKAAVIAIGMDADGEAAAIGRIA